MSAYLCVYKDRPSYLWMCFHSVHMWVLFLCSWMFIWAVTVDARWNMLAGSVRGYFWVRLLTASRHFWINFPFWLQPCWCKDQCCKELYEKLEVVAFNAWVESLVLNLSTRCRSRTASWYLTCVRACVRSCACKHMRLCVCFLVCGLVRGSIRFWLWSSVCICMWYEEEIGWSWHDVMSSQPDKD